MSAHVEPLRLVLLAEEPEWAALLRARLETLGGAFPLITAPNWEAASSLFDDGGHGLLLTTPACQPAPNLLPDGSTCTSSGQCSSGYCGLGGNGTLICLPNPNGLTCTGR